MERVKPASLSPPPLVPRLELPKSLAAFRPATPRSKDSRLPHPYSRASFGVSGQTCSRLGPHGSFLIGSCAGRRLPLIGRRAAKRGDGTLSGRGLVRRGYPPRRAWRRLFSLRNQAVWVAVRGVYRPPSTGEKVAGAVGQEFGVGVQGGPPVLGGV